MAEEIRLLIYSTDLHILLNSSSYSSNNYSPKAALLFQEDVKE